MLHKLGIVTLTLGSAAASAMLMYALLGMPVAIAVMLVLISHEFAHAFSALGFGASVWPPFFVPLGVGVLGLTRVRNLDPAFRSAVAIAGPLTGMFVAATLLALTSIAGLAMFTLPLLLVFGAELFSATIGSDGRKYRNARINSTLLKGI